MFDKLNQPLTPNQQKVAFGLYGALGASICALAARDLKRMDEMTPDELAGRGYSSTLQARSDARGMFWFGAGIAGIGVLGVAKPEALHVLAEAVGSGQQG